MRRGFWMLVLLVLAANSNAGENDGKPQFLDKSWIKVANKKILVEIADDDRERSAGLMYRESLKPNSGMLFIFDRPQVLAFWMRNTLIPLSIGFYSNERKLLNVLEMKPASQLEKSPKHYYSEGMARYALEMPTGWFKENKIPIGSALEILQGERPADQGRASGKSRP